MRDLLAIALIAIIALPKINSIKKCPIECTCDMDPIGRYSALCERGEFIDLIMAESLAITMLFNFLIFHYALICHFILDRKHEANLNQGF